MGYTHKVKNNLRSTKEVTAEEILEEVIENKDYLSPRKIKNCKHIIQVTAMKFEGLKGILSSDQTGAFPHMSARGNRYIIVMEDSDAGPIIATAIKSRHKEHLLEGFKEMHDTLIKVGINPVLHRIDNEFSKELIKEIEARGLKYQTTLGGNHQTVAAEHGCDPTFPKNQWDRVLPVAVLTLNMMRPSQINPAKSVYNKIWRTLTSIRLQLPHQDAL